MKEWGATPDVQKAMEKKAFDAINDVLSGKKSARESPTEKKTGVPPANEVQDLLKGYLADSLAAYARNRGTRHSQLQRVP